MNQEADTKLITVITVEDYAGTFPQRRGRSITWSVTTAAEGLECFDLLMILIVQVLVKPAIQKPVALCRHLSLSSLWKLSCTTLNIV